ncbi:MAG TPA: hypothetical protein VMH02_06680 [Verrucomicrobiae bacterium]|nr:hypothetical protein [Verrucomicrobiae bacterium]
MKKLASAAVEQRKVARDDPARTCAHVARRRRAALAGRGCHRDDVDGASSRLGCDSVRNRVAHPRVDRAHDLDRSERRQLAQRDRIVGKRERRFVALVAALGGEQDDGAIGQCGRGSSDQHAAFGIGPLGVVQNEKQRMIQHHAFEHPKKGLFELLGLLTVEGQPGSISLGPLSQCLDERLDHPPGGEELERGMDAEAWRAHHQPAGPGCLGGNGVREGGLADPGRPDDAKGPHDSTSRGRVEEGASPRELGVASKQAAHGWWLRRKPGISPDVSGRGSC